MTGKMSTSRTARRLRAGLVLALGTAIAAGGALSQAVGKFPADIIRLLTYQSGRKLDPSLALGFTCGSLGTEIAENRAMAKSLVELGRSATPDLAKALDSVDARGDRSEYFINSAWLIYAYARIEGSAAYPRLWKMVGNP